MTRNDILFAGTRILGLYFAATLVLRAPSFLNQLFDWREPLWIVLSVAAHAAVAFAFAVKTQALLDAVGGSADGAASVPASQD